MEALIIDEPWISAILGFLHARGQNSRRAMRAKVQEIQGLLQAINPRKHPKAPHGGRFRGRYWV